MPLFYNFIIKEFLNMAREKRKWDKQKYDKDLAVKKTKGELSFYNFSIEVRDFSSLGMSNCVHHFQTSLALVCIYILKWLKKIVDIREQYPILDFYL